MSTLEPLISVSAKQPHADNGSDCFVAGGAPRFNNRHRSFDLIDHDGRVCIRYVLPGRRAYRREMLEAAEIIRDHPCEHIAAIYKVSDTEIIGQYIADAGPLGKIGVTSDEFKSWYIARARRGRFHRRHLRPQLTDVRDNFETFVDQMSIVARHMQAHALWHGDLVPQNVLWSTQHKKLWLVDVAGFLPRHFLDGRPGLIYERGRRDQGVIRLEDYSIDKEYLRRRFLQDLAPWPVIVARKWSLLRPI